MGKILTSFLVAKLRLEPGCLELNPGSICLCTYRTFLPSQVHRNASISEDWLGRCTMESLNLFLWASLLHNRQRLMVWRDEEKGCSRTAPSNSCLLLATELLVSQRKKQSSGNGQHHDRSHPALAEDRNLTQVKNLNINNILPFINPKISH